MIIKLAIALVVVLVVVAFATWAFLPACHLPGNRARHLQIRLHLRLHPGKGFAHLLTLHLRWSRFAALRRSSRIRPALPLRYRILDPREHSVFLGRAHYRHGLRVPLIGAHPDDGATAHVQDGVPGRCHPALPRPGHRHHHQGGPVQAHQRRAVLRRPGPRVQPPAHRRRPVHLLLVPGRRMRRPGHRDPPRRRVRVRRLPERRRRRHLLVRQSLRLPARLLPRRRPRRLRPARRRRLGLRRRPAHPRTDPRCRRRLPMGADPGRTPLRGPQDRRDRPDGHEQVLGLHGRPRPGRLRPARPRNRVRHPAVPARRGHRLHDRRSRQRGSPRRPAVRRHGVRDPLDRSPDRAGVAVGPAGPAAADGLDEVTQICPVPLPSWLSDSGGKGIQICAVVHGEAQLAERWGDHGRQVVLDTSSVKVFLPGITDVSTLQAASTLCGQASWKVRGQDHATRHDVATPDMIRQLPAGFALVIRGGCAPVIARLPRAWRNPAYRRARRLHAGAQHELPPAPQWSEPVIPRHVPTGTFLWN